MRQRGQKAAGHGSSTAPAGLIFLIAAIGTYVVGYFVDQAQTLSALSLSAASMRVVVLPLLLVFLVLLLTNRYLQAQTVARFVGAHSGIRGVSLALLAAIVSTGPAYAWYPFLSEIRKKGAGTEQVAVFLYGRAIKPFLLPVMAVYFGVVFTVVLNLIIAAGALVTGRVVGQLLSDGETVIPKTPHGRVS